MTTDVARTTFLPALTGLRGVAALAVFAFHLWGRAGEPAFVVAGYPLHALAACGYLGVDLFFVLSGFLLALPFVSAAQGRRPFPSLREFFVRRARRVVPAYWAHLAVLVVVAYVVDGRVFDAGTLVAHLVFLQILVPGVAVINPVTWTLAVEWTFYLVLPVIGWLLLRARWGFIVVLVVLWAVTFRLLIHRWWFDASDGWVANPGSILHFNARVDQFCFGIAIAWLQLRAPVAPIVRRVCLAIGVVGLLALVPWLAARGDVFGRADFPWLLAHFSVVGLLWALVVFGLAAPRDAATSRTPRVLAWFGTISFSLYLWHLPVIDWTWRAGLATSAGVGVAAGVAIVATIVVSWLSYRVVERPFLHAPAAEVKA